MTEELKKKVNRIIDYCQTQADIYNNFQLGTKVSINAIYGSFGFSGFYFYNPNLAEAVTKQGKNVILYAEKILNLWAQKFWLKDEKTHKLMGIKITKPNEEIKPISRYIDTDSCYCSYYQIVNTTDWMDHDVWRLTKINKQNDQKEFVYVSQGGYPTEDDARKYFDVDSIDTTKYEWSIDIIEPEGREFCLTLARVFMSDFMKKTHDKYAQDNGTESLLDFELEAYNEAGIWLAKKKYIKNMTWAEPNVYYDSCTKIKATGVEIAQTSSSQWVKNQLIDLVKWIFQQEEFTIDNFISKKLEPLKKQFMLQSPETISVNKAMNKYSEYVLSDSGEIELAPKSMVTCAGAALYNYILNNNEKFKKRYTPLFDADKLCVLYIKPTSRYTYWKTETQVPVSEYVKNPDMYKLISNKKETRKGNIDVYTDIMSLQKCEAFSYPAGMFPMDMAANLEIDKNKMFDLLILSPVNRIVEAMGFQPVDISMTYAKGLW